MMSNKKIHPAASKEKNNAMSQVLFESQGSKDQVVVLETQMQGSKDQALGNETQGSKDQALDYKIPPSGTITRSDAPTSPPSPSKMLSKVTHSFVYELVKEVVSKFVTLAILEETLAKYQSMVSGHTKISEELCIKRRLPHLAPGCKFSLGARSELKKWKRNIIWPMFQN